MAIPKLNSKDLNQVLQKAQGSIENMRNDVDSIRANMNEKMNILKNEQEYAINEITKISTIIHSSEDSNKLRGVKNKIIPGLDNETMGVFDKYGSTVHKRFLRAPVNVFNLMTTNGPMFRDNIEVTINGESRDKYKQILMHVSSYGKGVVFGEYDSPNLKLEVEVDTSNLLGDTDFNVIEIDPFLAGSFNIEGIKIFDINRDVTSKSPDHEIKGIKNIGPSRIILERKYELLKIEFDIKLLYKNSIGKYPFGIKHLYFLNADFDPESHIISKIEKNDYIETISDKIFINDQYGKREASASEEGLRVYLNESNGVLEYELEMSSHNDIKPLARNTKSFYVRLPLQYYAIASIEFSNIESR